MIRWFRHLFLGVFIGLLGVIVHLSPADLLLEEKFGLYWLFQLRGAVTAPKNVVVVAIDQPSATQLDLPVTPRLWPRDLHAQLIEQLTQAGARIIVFDLIFDTPSAVPAHDERLAYSMKMAGNIVLVERLVYENAAPHADPTGQEHSHFVKEGPIPLLPIITDAIKAQALLFPCLKQRESMIIGFSRPMLVIFPRYRLLFYRSLLCRFMMTLSGYCEM